MTTIPMRLRLLQAPAAARDYCRLVVAAIITFAIRFATSRTR
ncbi:MAG: hypothetical protein U0074_05600 [Kouleothrix sp.]